MKTFVMVLSLFAVAVFSTVTLAFGQDNGADAALVERLISRSPWVGTMEDPFGTVISLWLTFYKDEGGRLNAKFGNGDPALFLRIDRGKVVFESTKRATFVLALENGVLSGPGYPQYSVKSLHLTLHPSDGR